MNRALVLVAAAALAGCATARTIYAPARAAPSELTLSYDSGFQIRARNQPVAQSPSYSGLDDFVRCVPDAHRHATAAESWGTSSSVLSGLSIGFALGGLGGLGGLAWRGRDDGAMAAALAGGAALEVGAILMGALSLDARAHAHGNALDAVNYYNDAKGYSGEGCAGR